jgi:hypothetical protein
MNEFLFVGIILLMMTKKTKEEENEKVGFLLPEREEQTFFCLCVRE